jgi:hypothetical protein
LAISTADLWDTIAAEASRESELWTAALRPLEGQERRPVFSLLGEERYALGIETIYEGYLLHYGAPRLFAPADRHTALLLGDYLYAHGLVRIAAWQSVAAVADLAALISLCAQLRAEGAPGDGEAWAATAALLGHGPLFETHEPAALGAAAREAAGDAAVERALANHAPRVS